MLTVWIVYLYFHVAMVLKLYNLCHFVECFLGRKEKEKATSVLATIEILQKLNPGF